MILKQDSRISFNEIAEKIGKFMKVEIESLEKFNPLIEERLAQIKGIKIVETCFITDVIK